MKRTVFWSEAALSDLQHAITYIATHSPEAARKVLADIRTAVDTLGIRATGRPGRVAATYEKSVTNRPYIIAYALDELPGGPERVVILHIIHAARDWPPGQWPQ